MRAGIYVFSQAINLKILVFIIFAKTMRLKLSLKNQNLFPKKITKIYKQNNRFLHIPEGFHIKRMLDVS